MIIKCERLYNANTKQFHPGPSNRDLTIGNFYAVLEIDYCKTEVFYRIFDDCDYEFSILVRSDEFSIVSGKTPSNWEIFKGEYSTRFCPRNWKIFEPWEESFWQDWDNNLPKARKCFDDELRIIFECDKEYIKIIDQQQGKKPYFPDLY